MAFASQRAASHLNDELKGASGRAYYPNEGAGQTSEEVAKAIFSRRVHNIEQALKIAEQRNISRSETDVPADELPDSEMFLLGRPMLQARSKICRPLGQILISTTTRTARCSIP